MEKSNVEDIYPLTPMQQGMLFHSLYASESDVYFTQLSGNLHGAESAAIFPKALQRAAARHAILRTSFLWESLDEPLQVVRRDVQLPVKQIDWRGRDSTEQDRSFELLLIEDRKRGFDFVEAPLMRLILARTAEENYRFVWSHHHLLLDGWSFSLLVQQVLQECEAMRQLKPITFAPARPYRDYLGWLKQQDLAASKTYWRQALAGFVEPSRIADQKPSPAVQSGRGIGTLALSMDLSSQLTGMARQHQLTLSTLVQAAWAMVLSRHTAKQDVLFGAVVSGRPAELPGVESMIGLFINVMPVRAILAREQPALAWIKQIQSRQVEARQYEYTPLIEIQGWSDVPRGTQLFDSIVVFENYPALSSDPARGPHVSNLALFERANYPVTLIARPGAVLELTMNYDPQYVGAASAIRLLNEVETVLDQFARNPERPLGKISLLKPSEKHVITTRWNRTETTFPRQASITELFETQASKSPDREAVRYGDCRLSYAELNRRANQLARVLRNRGIRTGQPVALCLERSVDLVVSMLAIVKAGAFYVPLDPAYPSERLAIMFADTRASVLITAGVFLDRFAEFGLNTIALDPDNCEIAAEIEENLDIFVDASELAYVMYTSGSTGSPKGIGIAHRAVIRLVMNSDYVQLKESDRVAQIANASFDAATFEIWGALLSGSCLVGIDKEVALSPDEFIKQIRLTSVSTIFLTTALFNRLATYAPEAFMGLRHVLFGGEAVDPQCVRRVLQCGKPERLLHVYGPTESTTFATWHEVTEVAAEATTVPIGRPLANTQVYVLDREMEPVPVDVTGELYLGGDGLARGYVGRPDLTAARFLPDPFSGEPGTRLYRTGDLVRYGEDGAIEFVGRNDGQVKMRGFRIELGEIEGVLRGHAGVRECCVMMREDSPGDKRLVAYVAACPETTALDLASRTRQQLPEYMMPSAWVLLESLPLNRNGKVDRCELPAPACTRPDQGHSYTAPHSPLERIVTDICADVLSIDRAGMDDSFFELGGHSLLATQFISRLRETFQVDIPLRTVFERPTLGAFCDALQSAPETREQIEATAEVLSSVAGMSDDQAAQLLEAAS